jgi:hypothetical protein
LADLNSIVKSNLKLKLKHQMMNNMKLPGSGMNKEEMDDFLERVETVNK